MLHQTVREMHLDADQIHGNVEKRASRPLAYARQSGRIHEMGGFATYVDGPTRLLPDPHNTEMRMQYNVIWP